MSSNEEDYNEGGESGNHNKKRRVQRACDICRRKKSDGVQMPGNRCSNCIAYSLECTYVEAAKKRGPPKAYVESLENRVEKMEALLHRILPDVDLSEELGLSPNSSFNISSPRNSLQLKYSKNAPTELAVNAIRTWDTQPVFPPPHQDEEAEHIMMTDNMKKLAVNPADHRFFGKSSGAMLIRTAIDLKQEYTGKETDIVRVVLGQRRPQFWQTTPWEETVTDAQHPSYNFPEDDLLRSLIDAYFDNVNIFLPLLHRPTFERSLAEKLHYHEDMFSAVVLLVCAVGARYMNDSRVLLDGVDSWHSSGWRYFDQVQLIRKSLLDPPTLYDLQFYCLSVQFLQGSSAPHSCWTMVGIGIRLAQDVGAHRRKITNTHTVEDELWNRAFWVLVCMDRMVSTALGRPCAIQDEDYDLDMPIECDDEYWENPDPTKAFRQPVGKPSVVSAFNCYLRLNRLLAFVLRTIYSINKSKILLGFVGTDWEQHIVAELDSALNQWIDSVPDHLRWDPGRTNETFFNQSVVLYSHYYHLQILVHRPFIPSPKKPSPLSFPSLAICTNAARSCSHVVDVQRKRHGRLLPFSQISVFTAGIVLLLNIWGGKRSGLSTDPNKEMADVYKCMEVLRSLEDRWHSAGRLWDILYELASVGELPLPKASPSAMSNKREWGSDSPISNPAGSSPTEGSPSAANEHTHASEQQQRNIAGSKRVSTSVVSHGASSGHAHAYGHGREQVISLCSGSAQASTAAVSSPIGVSGISPITALPQHSHSHLSNGSSPSNATSPSSPPGMQLFSLPMYSDELGRLPLHGQVHFSTRAPVRAGPCDTSGGVAPGFWNYATSADASSSGPPSSASSTAADICSQGYQDDLVYFNNPQMAGSKLGMLDGGAATTSTLRGERGGGRRNVDVFGLNTAAGEGAGGRQLDLLRGEGSGAVPAGAGPGFQGGGRPGTAPLENMLIDSDTIAMWSTAPTGFELDDWGTYLTNVSELTQNLHHGGAGQGG